MTGDVEIRVDSAEYRRVMNGLRSFDKRLYAKTRKRLRAAAATVIRDVQEEVRKGGPNKTGMREGLAEGTRARLTSGKRAGVEITTTPSKLPANKKAMAKAWNSSVFKHRVYGSATWRSQAGHPYFGTTIIAHRYAMQQAILAALQDAIREVESRS